MNSDEWEMGDYAQRRWCVMLAARGNLVLPTHEMNDNAPGTKAPMVLANSDLLVAPDALCFNPRATTWHEVKAKSQPVWRRTHRRWEHGIDHANAMHYSEVQDGSGAPVLLVVHESMSPVNPARYSRLVASDLWLWITLDEALQCGEHRPTWPGGKADPGRRGRDGRGGLLWARDAMREMRAP